MKMYAIKSLSVRKGDISYEVHTATCRDNYKDDPIDVFKKEANSAEDLITLDRETDIGREEYNIMPCVKE